MEERRGFKAFLELAGIALSYWLVIELGLQLVVRPEGIASVWPASGLAVAGTLIGHGFFYYEGLTQTERMIELQIFLLALAFFGQILTGVVLERKKAEALLFESRRRLELAERLGQAGSWMYDIETRKIIGSPDGRRIFGLPADEAELELERIEERIPERERVHSAMLELKLEGKEYDLEYSINPVGDGPPKTVHSIATLERNAYGKPVRVLGFLQDVSVLKENENALKGAMEENSQLLRELQHRAKNSFAMISSLIFVTSRETS